MAERLGIVRRLWRRSLPEGLRTRLYVLRHAPQAALWQRPRRLGALRRTTPVDADWGFNRGGAIDRVYIAEFLERHRADVRGRVLECQNDTYARRYGTGVERIDVLHAVEGNPKATIVADLVDAPGIPDGAFDTVILTQVLQFVYDVRAALRTVHRILAPGGVLLATLPGIAKIAELENDVYGDWWRFTSISARRLAQEAFGAGSVEVEAYGNVLSAAGFLYGLGRWDLRPDELAARDPLFEVTIGVRAVKGD